ncbi:MAG: phage major capsid protein, partial [Lentisphaeraceae bacterium]|nr:phage major capsid protein [Lentisphaeraceae bacterium]
IREYSDVRGISSVSTISTDKWEQLKMNQSNGATWEKNMANYTAQTKNNIFAKLSITIEDLYSIIIIHKNLVSDNAFNLVFHLLDNGSEDFAIAEGTSFWSGNGLGELKGILNTDDASDSFEKIERIETAAANTIAVEDMYDLIGALKLPYQRNAQIKAHRNAITVLRKLRSDSGAGAGTGNFLWQPSLIVGQPQTFNGLPLTQAPELSSTPLVNNTEAIVVGDFRKGYRVIDRMGTEVVRDELTQYPNIAFKMHKRVGGGPEKGEAIKILKTKSS